MHIRKKASLKFELFAPVHRDSCTSLLSDDDNTRDKKLVRTIRLHS